jgi:ribose 5-phosphate isomerase A
MASSRASGPDKSSFLSEPVIASQKRAAGEAAAELVQDGMRLGLGTGSTVAYLLEALGERGLPNVECAATSPATASAARALGLSVRELDELGELDLAIDGADQIDPDGWLVKGGGGAHTREKIVASAATRFVVIASANKAVEELGAPVPLELISFAVKTTLRMLGDAKLRPAPNAADSLGLESGGQSVSHVEGRWWQSPDGGLIADYLGPVGDPRACSSRLAAVPGVVEHGLFPPEMVSLILIATEDGVERRAGGKPHT